MDRRHGDLSFLGQGHQPRQRIERGRVGRLSVRIAAARRAARPRPRLLQQGGRRPFRGDAARRRARASGRPRRPCGTRSRPASCARTRSSPARSSSPFPRELNQEQGIELAREFVQREFVDRGMIADLNVHWDHGADGLAKPHAHVMLTMREVGEDGFGAKVRDWNSTELLKRLARGAGRSMSTHGWPSSTSTRGSITAALKRRASTSSRSTRSARRRHGWRAAAWRPSGSTIMPRIARDNGERIIADPEVALDAITRKQATFTKRDLAMFVHRHSDGKEQFDARDGGGARIARAGRAGPGRARQRAVHQPRDDRGRGAARARRRHAGRRERAAWRWTSHAPRARAGRGRERAGWTCRASSAPRSSM